MTSKANQSQGMLLFHLSARQSFRHRYPQGEGDRALHPAHRPATIPSTVLGAASMRAPPSRVIDMAVEGYRPIKREEMPHCFIIITDCRHYWVGFLVRASTRSPRQLA